MTLAPLLEAPLAVRLHVITVVPAFFLGAWLILVSRKGRRFHRSLGYVYLALMTFTAITSVFVHQIMPKAPFGLSPIHLFVPLTLFAVVGALRGAWTHNIPMHRRSMILLYVLYVGGLVIAGAFTFLPGRIMHAVVMGH
jgi:uncharacterized membrane protein